MLLRALKENIDKFESKYGEINIEGQANPKFGFVNAEKVEKVIKQLEELLEKQEYAISITYILSILAEHDFKFITENVIKVLENFINSDDPKLKVNTLITLGFAMLSSTDYFNKYLPNFIKNLGDENKDVRDNIYYFLPIR